MKLKIRMTKSKKANLISSAREPKKLLHDLQKVLLEIVKFVNAYYAFV